MRWGVSLARARTSVWLYLTQPTLHARIHPTMVKRYKVPGTENEYSRTALQREWSKRVNKYHTPSGRHRVQPEDKDWFIDVAFMFDKQRAKLYHGAAATVNDCKRQTNVFVDKAGLGFGSYHGKKSTHVRKSRCVYFQSALHNFKFRAVSSALADVNEVKDERDRIVEWLRTEIECQIKSFRKANRGGRCHLCRRPLSGKLTHVDHGIAENSFRCIAKDFQTQGHEGGIGRPLSLEDTKDAAIGRLWKTFHKSRANLTMTCSKCNLTNK